MMNFPTSPRANPPSPGVSSSSFFHGTIHTPQKQFAIDETEVPPNTSFSYHPSSQGVGVGGGYRGGGRTPTASPYSAHNTLTNSSSSSNELLASSVKKMCHLLSLLDSAQYVHDDQARAIAACLTHSQVCLSPEQTPARVQVSNVLRFHHALLAVLRTYSLPDNTLLVLLNTAIQSLLQLAKLVSERKHLTATMYLTALAYTKLGQLISHNQASEGDLIEAENCFAQATIRYSKLAQTEELERKQTWHLHMAEVLALASSVHVRLGDLDRGVLALEASLETRKPFAQMDDGFLEAENQLRTLRELAAQRADDAGQAGAAHTWADVGLQEQDITPSIETTLNEEPA